MGKKKIVKKSGGEADSGLKSRSLARLPKKKLESGTLHVQASYNNTRLSLTDKEGNTIMCSSSGALGFKGAKKGTPFAAAKVGELLGEKGVMIGLKSVNVVMRGVGGGREAGMRAFAGKGIDIDSIKDVTPIPFNGPRPRKARRV